MSSGPPPNYADEYQISHASTKSIAVSQSAEARDIGCGVKTQPLRHPRIECRARLYKKQTALLHCRVESAQGSSVQSMPQEHRPLSYFRAKTSFRKAVTSS